MSSKIIKFIAILNIVLVGYLFFELYQLKNPQTPTQAPLKQNGELSEAEINQLIEEAINPSIPLDKRIQALIQLPSKQLTSQQQSALNETFFQKVPGDDGLETLNLRERAGSVLIASDYEPVTFAEQLSQNAENETIPLPLRQQALVQLFLLVNEQSARGKLPTRLSAILDRNIQVLFSNRASSLAGTVIEGQSYLLSRHPEVVRSTQLQERVLRGLRDLRSQESVQIAALNIAAKLGVLEARSDAEAFAQGNGSNAVKLAALEAATTLGTEPEFFQQLSYSDNQLELARLKALKQASRSRAQKATAAVPD
ncbi:hypothetical protein [Cerasicoccus arenae]|uniref:Uncharacterized protein n=1 Tax=Cerasicoccus arenae TaxID=424488 RepID=A0A8J3DE69_9BACT|nr:hypothetical protein [Cerasicoccus arenae]MBK1859937.1 hypothetical protein [Cerasicoccus arenae]GHC13526.1 hypothetical protein GCM10007047_33600 [Cerasicoccus arenae]